MSKSKFNPIEYKKRNIQIWNEIAPKYHKRWASINSGPFQSTAQLVKLSEIKKGNSILDLACGTGVVTREILSRIGNKGEVIGVDSSKTAIKIAKKWNNHNKNLDFIISDAESFYLNKKFDAILCQYALFFFPSSKKVLQNTRRLLKKDGKLCITVHGINVPFFTSILNAVTKFIPDYVPPGSPNLDRFGTKMALRKEISDVGFSKIKLNEFVFKYSPGTFEDYWKNYLNYIAKPLKEKLDSLSITQRKEIKQLAKQNTKPYEKNRKILFPWQVLILTAKN